MFTCKFYFALFVPFVAILLSISGPGPAGLVAILAEHGAADLWLKRYSVVLAAIIADDLKPRRCVRTKRSLFRAAFCAPLRRHHVTLVISFLIFFAENKDLFALDTRNIDIRHSVTSKL